MKSSDVFRITKEEGRTLYLYDDYEEMVIMMYYDKSISDVREFVKCRGQQVREVSRKNKYIFDITNMAVECTKEFFDNF